MAALTTRRVAILVTVLSLIFCLVGVSMGEEEECTQGIHNGCNTYGFFSAYRTLFTPACNEHDACYFCVSATSIYFRIHLDFI